MDGTLLQNEFERIEHLGSSGLSIIQDKRLFCFGMDAVLLSHFANVKKGGRVCDLGSGNGIIPLLLYAKKPPCLITGVEIQNSGAELFRRNIALNKLCDIITVLEGDLRHVSSLLPKASFDYVTCNPPYKQDKSGIKSKADALSVAKHEILCTLDDVLKSASYLLRFGGRFSMVHRPNRLCDIISAMRKYNIEPKKMQFVHSKADKPPVLLLIEGQKGSGAFLNILPPLVIFNEDGSHTEELNKIYNNLQ